MELDKVRFFLCTQRRRNVERIQELKLLYAKIYYLSDNGSFSGSNYS